ncbi:MAG TPA: DUF4139 domain-containing protein, partial [Candidatus Cloacimonadota bacterium]|nr:DUF4139 domain-containing protein [Candidatus Cloacimonadota bacterium]
TVQDYAKTGGIFSEKNIRNFQYITKIKNNKTTEEEIVVWDQLPISHTEDIKVKLIEPKFKENTDTLKMTEENYIEWFFKIKPGEEIEVPFQYSVECPPEMKIEGL